MAVPSHLRSLQALELAVRLGSLSKAADALAITPAAVGQRIKALEDYLGIDLVVRARSGLKATAELTKALPHLNRAFAELAVATEALDLQRVNEIHIAANTDWVALWLSPRLPAFRALFPNIQFCINGEGDAPIRLGQTDLEVSFGPPRDDAHTDLLFHDYLAPMSSPENQLRVAKLRRKHKLEGFPLLHLDFYREDPGALDWPAWIAQHGHRKSAFDRGIRFRQIVAGLEAVKSDAGFMICGVAMTADQIESGSLTLPFGLSRGKSTSYAFHASYKPGSRNSAQVQRFRAWLSENAAETRHHVATLIRT